MVWRYLECKAYGVAVKETGSTAELLQKYADVISFDKEMSLEGYGTVFVYVKSSYKEIHNDSLTDEFPDIYGDDETMPQYPTFLVRENGPEYEIGDAESLALSVFDAVSKEQPYWIHYAHVYNDAE